MLQGDAASGKTRVFFEVAARALQQKQEVILVEYPGSLPRMERNIAGGLLLRDLPDTRAFRNAIYRRAKEDSFWLLVDNYLGENRALDHFLQSLSHLSCRIAVNFRRDEYQSIRSAFRALQTHEVFRLEPLATPHAKGLIEWARRHYGIAGDLPVHDLLKISNQLPGLMLGILALLQQPRYCGLHGYLLRNAYTEFHTSLHLNRGHWGLFEEQAAWRIFQRGKNGQPE